MQYIYENRSNETKQVVLVSEQNTSASTITFSPGARLPLSYPGLDRYVPHMLIRINADGIDLSHVVVAARTLAEEEAAKAASKSKKVAASKAAEESLKEEVVAAKVDAPKVKAAKEERK